MIVFRGKIWLKQAATGAFGAVFGFLLGKKNKK